MMRPRRLCEIWREADDGEIVILRDTTHATSLLRLNHTGALLWKAMDGNRTIEELVSCLREHVQGEPDGRQMEEEVKAFVAALHEAGLLEEGGN